MRFLKAAIRHIIPDHKTRDMIQIESLYTLIDCKRDEQDPMVSDLALIKSNSGGLIFPTV